MSADSQAVERVMMDIEPDNFRHVLAHLPTGVTVVAAHGEDGPVGMAANSVTSVSLEPPLILFCPAKSSTTWPKIRAAAAFCVNVMAGHHEEVTRRFAARESDRFAGVRYEDRPTGPALADAVAWIECRLHDEYEAGDHNIIVAQVVAIEAASTAELEPLVFFRGRYGSFRPPASAASGKMTTRVTSDGTRQDRSGGQART